MKKGVIEKIVTDKGFGFIAGKDKKQYFFHKTMLTQKSDWKHLLIGQVVEFDSVKGKKGLEAHSVVPGKKLIKISGMEDIPGIYGLVAISRGNYTDRDKFMHECDGLAFHGNKTYGGRFPKNDKMIGLLREMRAVFDRDNKIWFLRATQVPQNIVKINELIKESKRLRRNQLIASFLSGLGTIIVTLLLGSIMIAGIGFLLLMILAGAGSGFSSGPKISRTGNVWFAGKRYT